ncbi:FAD binding domain-containing protein [Colletotrichum orchidophilum]|uniref:FAD binding domain-containing protein n=1 Tax=Colletotrichum orchidophilum TaxID=1209926 RepID=A0A1G4BQX4_9PEZI|nr:FAD binding domain-containing protein [Colletotrichum orchidophilum]OHF03728.1 FAD binding domain-containing protein [Colletotrichum orchidophilum]
MPSKDFTVLIAGGGIAGLTLANLLEQVGINYVILEGYREMAPQVGASIGILPNGSRVLDQIGLYDQIRQLIDEPLFRMSLCDAKGIPTSEYRGVGEQIKRRHGYEVVFVDRQMILEVLWKNLKNKDKILVSKQVIRVSLEPSKVRVETSDGQSYLGDILVGADGVHSRVRSEMWRLADTMEPGYIPASEKTECLPTVYKCIFGISIIKDWEDSTVQTNFNKHFSYLVISGPSNRVYWFLFVNMGYTHYGPELPKYTKEDEAKLVKEHQDDNIIENFTFKDLYAARISSVLTPLPEYVFKKWHFNRIMTIGDAAHKLEPIAGQGGNSAIETAAVLVNNLTEALKQNPSGITTEQIHNVFLATQKKREPRVWPLVHASHKEQRFAAMENPLLEFASRYVVPSLSIDEKQGPWSTNVEGGHKLDFLDVPKRPRALPFLDELPSRKLDFSGLPKLVVGAALAGILFLAQRVLVIAPEAASGASFVGYPLKTVYTGNAQIDSVLSLLSWAFSEATSGPDPNMRLQCLYFLINLMPIIYIWTVEGYRNGSQLSLVSWPSLFAVYQLVGIGNIAPLYFLISLHTTSSEVYTRPTGRPIPSTVAKALIPALCLGYAIPTALMFIQYGDSVAQQNAIAFWQPSPLYVSLLTWTFSGLLRIVSPTKSLDWEIFEKKDQGALQTGYTLAFAITAITHVCALAYAGLSPSVSLFDTFLDLPSVASMALGHSIGGFWKYDMLLCFGAVAIWCLYTVYELRRLGYVTTRAAIGAAAATLLGQVLVGPGATYAGLWAWRENVIAGLVKD